MRTLTNSGAKAIQVFAPRNVGGQWVSAIEIDTGHPKPLRIMASADEALIRLIYAYAESMARRYVQVRHVAAPRVGNIFGDIADVASDIADTAERITSSDEWKTIAAVAAFIPGGQGLAMGMGAASAYSAYGNQGLSMAHGGSSKPSRTASQEVAVAIMRAAATRAKTEGASVATKDVAASLIKAAVGGDKNAVVKVYTTIKQAKEGNPSAAVLASALKVALDEGQLLMLAARDFTSFLRALG